MLFNLEVVKQFLPHRDPFLFVDSIEAITLPEAALQKAGKLEGKDMIGAEVTGHYRTRAEHPIFAGHFPGRPILPGVVQVEMMAQISSFALCRLIETPPSHDNRIDLDVALLSVNDAKFRKPILPGMDLVIKTVCQRYRGSMMSCDGKIYYNNELMSEASVMAVVKL